MTKLLIALRLIPAILQTVWEVENVIPLPKKGKEKLDFVLDVVEQTQGTAENVKPIVEAVANAAVKLYKKTGIFR
jgi:hypothetical protein